MYMMRYSIPLIIGACVACGSSKESSGSASSGGPGEVANATVSRTDVVSDQSGAKATDPMLVNAWGLAFNPQGAAWINAAESGISAVYDASGAHVLPAVRIPSASGEAASPTGVVFNTDANAFKGDTFIFVTEDGTIAGWQQSNGTAAVKRADGSGAIYKGVTIATAADGRPRLFAADFHGGKIDVFDDTYAMVMGGDFADPDIPSGFAPFNVEAVHGSLVVTYAKQDDAKKDDVRGPGNGYVDIFDADGALMARLVSEAQLDAPWGIALAPETFAPAPNSLLVGNFGDGRINVYDFEATESTPRGEFVGVLTDEKTGHPIVIDGLWALKFGVDAGGFKAGNLYFTAGPDGEKHGAFGTLEVVSAASSGTAPGTTVRAPGYTRQ
jgi:uncharacterized protein (TIGR03118 family)